MPGALARHWVKSTRERFAKSGKILRRNLNGNGFLIYVSMPDARAYREYEAEASDCVGLEPLFARTPENMEERL
jgi:hypothetical protein